MKNGFVWWKLSIREQLVCAHGGNHPSMNNFVWWKSSIHELVCLVDRNHPSMNNSYWIAWWKSSIPKEMCIFHPSTNIWFVFCWVSHVERQRSVVLGRWLDSAGNRRGPSERYTCPLILMTPLPHCRPYSCFQRRTDQSKGCLY